MGIFGGISKLARGVGSAVGSIARSPLAKVIPGAGLVAGGISMIDAGTKMFGSSSKPSAPSLPMYSTSSTLPMVQPDFDRNPGIIPRGPGGSWQVPWTGASAPEALEKFALDDQFLKITYRAPKGYVVLRDANGKPFPVLKQAAKAFGMWKPAKKPPISVRDWEALKRADRAVKKLKSVGKKAERIANFKMTRTRTVKDPVYIGKGKVC